VGRDEAIGFLGNTFWITLVVGTVALIVWTIIAFIRFTRREVRQYREEVGRDRREGRPWLYTFIAWPGIIGNFAVIGLAALHYFGNSCRAVFGDCLQQIPFWFFPVSLLLLSIPVMWIEKLVLRWRKPRTPAAPR
jgi:hypothetical protein